MPRFARPEVLDGHASLSEAPPFLADALSLVVWTSFRPLAEHAVVTQASCRDSDRNWVLDPTTDAHCPPTIYSLLVICAQCPVRRACLEYALSTEIECVGIWGASTTFERRRLLPIHNSAAWLEAETRRRAITDAIETLEIGLPTRLKEWRRRASRFNKARITACGKPPRYPLRRAPVIA